MATQAPQKRTARKRAVKKAQPVHEEPAKTASTPVVGAQYRALRKMTVRGRVVVKGEMVPEARFWPRVETWVMHGYLEVVDDE